MNTEKDLRAELVAAARATVASGLSHGTTGNLSVRSGEDFLITPTNSSMAGVTAEELSVVAMDGTPLTAANPSKEAPLHAAIYQNRPDVQVVLHTHSVYATAVACLEGLDMADALPVITAYYAMRVERLPVVGYFPPGDDDLAVATGEMAMRHSTMLLRNHGVVVAADTLAQAISIAEEIEQTARLYLLLSGRPLAVLSAEERARLSPPPPVIANGEPASQHRSGKES